MYLVDEKTKKQHCEQFGKTEQEANEDVKNIRMWLETQPHLPEVMDEVKIRNMFNLCKFNLDKTKEKIDNYYTARSKYPELFEDSNPKLPHMKKMLETVHYSLLPKPLNGIHRVFFISPQVPNNFEGADVLKMFMNVMEIRLNEDYMVDDIFIADMKNITFRDMCRVHLRILYKIIKVYQGVYSLRLYKTYLVNSPSYITFLMKILKYILPEKIYSRFEVFQDDEVLKDVLPKDDLPKDYGGQGFSLDELDGMLRKKLDEYQERFDLLDNLRVNESLRPKTSLSK